MIPPKRFDISLPDWGMLRSRCVQLFLQIQYIIGAGRDISFISCWVVKQKVLIALFHIVDGFLDPRYLPFAIPGNVNPVLVPPSVLSVSHRCTVNQIPQLLPFHVAKSDSVPHVHHKVVSRPVWSPVSYYRIPDSALHAFGLSTKKQRLLPHTARKEFKSCGLLAVGRQRSPTLIGTLIP